jgi:hypothetical protein
MELMIGGPDFTIFSKPDWIAGIRLGETPLAFFTNGDSKVVHATGCLRIIH